MRQSFCICRFKRIIMYGNRKIENFGLKVERIFIYAWIVVCCIGSFTGNLYVMYTGQPPKDWIASWTFNWITGPRIYFNYLIFYLWSFRMILFIIYYIRNKAMLQSSFQIYFCDISVTILFFPLHQVTVLIHSLTGFKISGHCFILFLSQWMYRREGKLSFLCLNTKIFLYLTLIILLLHYFFLFFTCFAYHTFIEVLCGSLFGSFLCSSVHSFLISDPILNLNSIL